MSGPRSALDQNPGRHHAGTPPNPVAAIHYRPEDDFDSLLADFAFAQSNSRLFSKILQDEAQCLVGLCLREPKWTETYLKARKVHLRLSAAILPTISGRLIGIRQASLCSTQRRGSELRPTRCELMLPKTHRSVRELDMLAR